MNTIQTFKTPLPSHCHLGKGRKILCPPQLHSFPCRHLLRKYSHCSWTNQHFKTAPWSAFPGHLCIHNHQLCQFLTTTVECRTSLSSHANTIASHILYESSQFASMSPLSVPIIPSVQLLEWLFLKGSLTRNSLQADHHTVHFKSLSDSLLTCFPSISCPLQPNHTDFLFSQQILHTQSYSEQPALALFPMFSLVT